jgi:hypothetical protein
MRLKLRVTAAFLFWLLHTSYSFASTISIVGPAANPNIGDTFEVDVNATGITDLYAFQFDLTFDPTILEADSVTEGAFLPSGGTTFFIPGTIDNVGGDISANADTLIGAISGVTGDGTLAEFDFTALADGTSAISFANNILLDSSLNDSKHHMNPSGGEQVFAGEWGSEQIQTSRRAA